MKSKVAIVKAQGETVKSATKKAIDMIDGLRNLEGKKNVAIKPNLCRPSSSHSGATTDIRVVEAVIEKINEAVKCKIRIVETDNFIATADKTFKVLGYLDLEKKYSNVECVNLSKDEKLTLSLDGKILKTLQVPESLVFSDYLVSIAKLKTHADYYYTGVLKNAYGFLLSRYRRARYHGFMHEILTDLNMFYKPDLSIIDGMTGMEGFGPVGGKPKKVGVIIASRDPVAADAVGVKIIGMNPLKIKYLKYAKKNGLGNIKNIEIVGCNIEEVKTKFDFIPKKWLFLGKVSLGLQRVSIRLSNFGRLLSLARSAMSTIGYSELRSRTAILDLLGMAKDVIFKIND